MSQPFDAYLTCRVQATLHMMILDMLTEQYELESRAEALRRVILQAGVDRGLVTKTGDVPGKETKQNERQ